MKFNMGCGRRHKPGYVNVDAWAGCEPDEVWDLETTPWPWADGCAEEVRFVHSLEHMGADAKVFLAMIQELYRILAPGGQVIVQAPHPRHDNFINDPTHVRIITPDLLSMFDRRLNDEWQRLGGANTPLAHITGVDFEITDRQTVLSPPYAKALQEGKITQAQVAEMVQSRLNVAEEYRITLRARKP